MCVCARGRYNSNGWPYFIGKTLVTAVGGHVSWVGTLVAAVGGHVSWVGTLVTAVGGHVSWVGTLVAAVGGHVSWCSIHLMRLRLKCWSK